MFINSTFKFQSYSAYSLQWPPIQFVTLSLLSIVCLSSMLQCVCLCHEFIPIQFALCHILWAEYRGGKLLIFLFVFCIYLQPMTSLSNLLWWLGRWSFHPIFHIYFLCLLNFLFFGYVSMCSLCANVADMYRVLNILCVDLSCPPPSLSLPFFGRNIPWASFAWRLEQRGLCGLFVYSPTSSVSLRFLLLFFWIFSTMNFILFLVSKYIICPIFIVTDDLITQWIHEIARYFDISLYDLSWFSIDFESDRYYQREEGEGRGPNDWLTAFHSYIRYQDTRWSFTQQLLFSFINMSWWFMDVLSLSLSFSSLEAQRPYGVESYCISGIGCQDGQYIDLFVVQFRMISDSKSTKSLLKCL